MQRRLFPHLVSKFRSCDDTRPATLSPIVLGALLLLFTGCPDTGSEGPGSDSGSSGASNPAAEAGEADFETTPSTALGARPAETATGSSARFPSPEDGRFVYHVQVDLNDGSKMIGAPAIGGLELQTEYGVLLLPWHRIVRAYRQGHADPTFRVEVSGKENISGEVALAAIELHTAHGDLSIALENVRSMVTRKVPAGEGVDLELGLVTRLSLDAPTPAAFGQAAGALRMNIAQDPEGRSYWQQVQGAWLALPELKIPEGPVSLALWLKIDRAHQHNQYILSNGGSSSNSQGLALLYSGLDHGRKHGYPGQSLGFFAADRELNFRAAVFAPVSSGTWHHIVATWDGTPTPESLEILIDGEAVDGIFYDSPNGPFGPSQMLTLGAVGPRAKWQMLGGGLRDLRLFDRKLSSQEAWALANE